METGPPALIDAIVGRLIPPAAREHVLGDLLERSRSTRQFVSDAVRTVPWVIVSQVRRTSDRLLVFMQAYTLFLVLRPQRFTSAAPYQVWHIAVPIAAALLVLALRDAYRLTPGSDLDFCIRESDRGERKNQDLTPIFDAALGRALVDAALATMAVWVADPALGTRVFGAFIMLTPVRIGWDMMFRANGYRRVAWHSAGGDATKDAWRQVARHRRDLLRSRWLWYLAPLLLMSYAMVLLKPSQSVWTVVVEASVTAFALLLLHALIRRLADLLDRDINSE